MISRQQSIPDETSWIKAIAFTWSSKKRYAATVSATFMLIFVSWLIAFKQLDVRKKNVRILEQECIMLEHEMSALKEETSHLKKSAPITCQSASTLLTCLTHLLESAGITLESYTTTQRKKGSCSIKLTVTGTFESFMDFLESLKNEVQKLQLKNITLTRQHTLRLQAHIELQSTPLM